LKKRILILSGVIPALGRGGGCLALHRHFVERDDCEVVVAGASLLNGTASHQIDLSNRGLLARLHRTRLRRFFVNFQILSSWLCLPGKIKEVVRNFRPDCIFTVPDNLHLGWAWRASREFRIPVVVNFQDLFPISRFVPESDRPYRWVSRILIRTFHYAAKHSEVVFYTSEGMQQFFSTGKNGHVLYPVGARIEIQPNTSTASESVKNIVYAGNCYGAYGRMLLRLARELENNSQFRLKIFTAGNDWPKEDQDYFRAKGVLLGFRPFEELKSEFQTASAFLTVMSFEESERDFVRTSFTTKWLDYAPFGKPVFAWAPDYSSAAIFALKYDCGVVLDVEDTSEVLALLLHYLADAEKCRKYGEASLRIAQTVLHADKIHAILTAGLDV
jgi:hypothetical protein